jgi:Holliday junction DNA helicase RuvA
VIAKLSGVVDSTGEDWAVIDVAGVGYLVFCSTATLGALPPVGEPVSLLTETHVRTDHIHLYGFLNVAERDWFRLLLTVQGVGAKVALAILSVMRPDDLVQVMLARDRTGLTQADGVGPKLAARIVNELREKVGGIVIEPTAELAAVAPAAVLGSEAAGAVSALVNLGYRRTEAFGAIAHAAQRLGREAPVAELIRAGLKELSS